MCTSSVSGSDSDSSSASNGWSKARGVVLKSLVLMGGALLLKRLTKSTTRWDHARIVADSLAGEKVNFLSIFRLLVFGPSLVLIFFFRFWIGSFRGSRLRGSQTTISIWGDFLFFEGFWLEWVWLHNCFLCGYRSRREWLLCDNRILGKIMGPIPWSWNLMCLLLGNDNVVVFEEIFACCAWSTFKCFMVTCIIPLELVGHYGYLIVHILLSYCD